MNISQLLSRALDHAVPNPTGTCNVCERMGFPILPLRAAYAPSPLAMGKRAVAGAGGLEAVQMRLDQPRTLRQGYLYVLLDKAQWQAYEVTPEGALRQFNPFAMPREDPRPLSDKCIKADHFTPASFININTARHSEAWIAFSSDPWSESVLHRYEIGFGQDKTSLEPRFLKLDLKAARNDPASVGIAMTEDALQVDQQVLEYASPTAGDFNSVHGFCTRNHRLEALRGFVRVQAQCEHLPNGVLAVVLPDPVGLVQEINHQRAGWVRERQAFEADPVNHYKFFTSETLKRLRELCKQAADDFVPDRPNAGWEIMPSEAGSPPIFGDPARERAEQVEHKAQSLIARLDERYDEAARAAWEKTFETARDRLQQQVDQMAELYESQIRHDPLFRLIERYDYDARNVYSVAAYIQTLELCLRGGITEAPPKPDAQGNIPPLTGPSARAWEAWIKDGESIVFKTLLACDRDLMQGLVPTFSNQGELSWNDFNKLYTPISKIIISDDLGQTLLWPIVQDAIASVLAAYNGAVGRLGDKVDTGVRNVATRVNSAALLLYSHTYMTQVVVTMKLGEYYTLMCKQITEDRNKLVAAIEQATGKAHRQVRSVLTGGVLSLALSDPKLAEQAVDVVLWVEGTASDLRQRFGNLAQDAGAVIGDATHRAGVALGELRVLAGTLEPGARKALAGLQLSAYQAAELAQSSLRGARSAASIARGALGSAELLLAVGATYLLSQSLRTTIDTVDQTLGAKHEEAVLALYSASIGVLGGSIEVVGLTMKGGATKAKAILRLPASGVGAVTTLADAGKVMARFGAVIGALSGLFDALASVKAAKRARDAGGEASRDRYHYAAFSFIASAVASGIAAYTGSTAILSTSWILGPVGWAIAAGVTAYVLWKLAEKAESSPVERWAYYSHFGKAVEDKFADANSALSALNGVVLGLDVHVSFGFKQLKYQIALPRYDSSVSGYAWKLIVKRYSGEELLVSDTYQLTRAASNTEYKPPKWLDYDSTTTAPTFRQRVVTTVGGGKTNFLIVDGDVELTYPHDIDEAKIIIEYLPSVHDPEMVATMEIVELK